MFCQNCGAQIEAGMRFCTNCGAPVSAPDPQQTQQPKIENQQPVQPEPQEYAQPTPQEYAQPTPQEYAQPTPQEYAQPAPQGYAQPTPQGYAQPTPQGYAQPTPQGYVQQAPQGYAQPAPQSYPQGYAQPQAQNYAPQFGSQPKPKKKFPVGIVIAAVVVVALVVGAVFLIPKLFKGDSIAELEKANMHDTIEDIKSSSVLSSGTTVIVLEPGTYLKTLLSSFGGIDASWLDNVKIDFSNKKSGNDPSYRLALSMNGTELVSMNALIDSNAKKLLFNVDGLSDKTAAINLSDISSELTSLADYSIDTDKMLDIIEKYFGIAMDSIGKSEKTSGTFTANGVSEDCTVLSIELSERQALKIGEKIVSTLIKDDETLTFIYDTIMPIMESSDEYYSPYGSSGISDMKEDLEDVLSDIRDEIEEASDDIVLKIVEYVSGKEIIGREFTGYDIDGEEEFSLVFGIAKNDGKFGVVLSEYGETLISGGGTYSKDRYNGTLQVSYEGTAFVNVKLIDFDPDAKSGTCELSFNQNALSEMTDSSSAALLSLANLRFDLEGENKIKISAMVGNESVLGVTLSRSAKSDFSFNKNQSQVDIGSWGNSIDFTAFVNRLQNAGIPTSLLYSVSSFLD